MMLFGCVSVLKDVMYGIVMCPVVVRCCTCLYRLTWSHVTKMCPDSVNIMCVVVVVLRVCRGGLQVA